MPDEREEQRPNTHKHTHHTPKKKKNPEKEPTVGLNLNHQRETCMEGMEGPLGTSKDNWLQRERENLLSAQQLSKSNCLPRDCTCEEQTKRAGKESRNNLIRTAWRVDTLSRWRGLGGVGDEWKPSKSVVFCSPQASAAAQRPAPPSERRIPDSVAVQKRQEPAHRPPATRQRGITQKATTTAGTPIESMRRMRRRMECARATTVRVQAMAGHDLFDNVHIGW